VDLVYGRPLTNFDESFLEEGSEKKPKSSKNLTKGATGPWVISAEIEKLLCYLNIRKRPSFALIRRLVIPFLVFLVTLGQG
jgi:hypothetical protein